MNRNLKYSLVVLAAGAIGYCTGFYFGTNSQKVKDAQEKYSLVNTINSRDESNSLDDIIKNSKSDLEAIIKTVKYIFGDQSNLMVHSTVGLGAE